MNYGQVLVKIGEDIMKNSARMFDILRDEKRVVVQPETVIKAMHN